jgi:serine protease Do
MGGPTVLSKPDAAENQPMFEPTRHRPQLSTLAIPLAFFALGCGSVQPVDSNSIANEAPPPRPAAVAPASKAVASSPSDVSDLVSLVSPSVVNITTTHLLASHSGQPWGMPGHSSEGHKPRRRGAGTGFIIDDGSYVVTNAHVVRGANEVRVRLHDRRQFKAAVVGRDSKLDLALLKLDAAAGKLKPTVLGDSRRLRVGQSVLAVGNPFGLGHTVTMGIVSAKARSIGASAYDAFIQTDASINPGNSGGPLFNLRGEVIGINTAIRAGADGIGFAIPVASLHDVLDQLKTKGFVERGMLGLQFQPVTQELATAFGLKRPRGAVVTDIVAASAAAKAGLKSGDVLLSVNGQEVGEAAQLPRLVARNPPGSSIELGVLRRGKRLQIRATLDRLGRKPRPQPSAPPPAPATETKMLGLQVRETPSNDGVMVMATQTGVRSVRRGDVIVAADHVPVSNSTDLVGLVAKRKRGEVVVLKLRRGQRHRYVGLVVR